MSEFFKKIAVGGAVLTIITVLFLWFAKVLLIIFVGFILIGLAHATGDLFFPNDEDNHGV